MPWQITPRLTLKAQLVGSTTLAGAPVVAFSEAMVTVGWAF